MPNVCDMSEFRLGTHLKIIGTIKYSMHPYLWVLNKSDITKESNETKKISDLLKGTKMPKRQLDAFNLTNVSIIIYNSNNRDVICNTILY